MCEKNIIETAYANANEANLAELLRNGSLKALSFSLIASSLSYSTTNYPNKPDYKFLAKILSSNAM